jgi:alkanesulfonate monooxygenase SsuD/methylene tetrahydromethanopterin reductase-like flavin-dependent oxidoreductase (luciferase family)
MLSLVALAIHDANNAAIAVYNSFSPSTAIGAACPVTSKLTVLPGVRRQIQRSICYLPAP